MVTAIVAFAAVAGIVLVIVTTKLGYDRASAGVRLASAIAAIAFFAYCLGYTLLAGRDERDRAVP